MNEKTTLLEDWNSKRIKWKARIIKLLKEGRPHSRKQLKEKLKVPKKEEKTFSRAISDLIKIGIIEGEHLLHLHGLPKAFIASLSDEMDDKDLPGWIQKYVVNLVSDAYNRMKEEEK